MKITKKQLKQIIKEELQNALNEEGVPPMDMGLPNDVGTPEKLLDALEPLINRGDIQGRYAGDIVSLIDKQLKKSSESSPYVVDELQRIKDDLIHQYMPLLAKSRERRSARRDQYRSGADQAEWPPSRMTTLQSLGIGESAKMKITKQQLKQIVKEELETLVEARDPWTEFHGRSAEERGEIPYASADPETERELDIFPLIHRLAVDDETGDALPEHEKAELSQEVYNLIKDRVRDYFGSEGDY